MPVEAANWTSIEDVPQATLDAAAATLVGADAHLNPMYLLPSEVRALLCALAPYATVASNYLDPS